MSNSLKAEAWQRLNAGDPDGAINLLSRALGENGRDAHASALLGIAYGQRGLYPQALQSLLNAIHLDPNNASHRCNYAVILERTGDAETAAEVYRQALQIDPAHSTSLARLAALVRTNPTPTPAPPPKVEVQAAEPSLGAIACVRCKQWTAPGMLCEACGAPLPPSPTQYGSSSPGGLTDANSFNVCPVEPEDKRLVVFDRANGKRKVSLILAGGVILAAILAAQLTRHFGQSARIPTGGNQLKFGDERLHFASGRVVLVLPSTGEGSLNATLNDMYGNSITMYLPVEAREASDILKQTLEYRTVSAGGRDRPRDSNRVSFGNRVYRADALRVVIQSIQVDPTHTNRSTITFELEGRFLDSSSTSSEKPKELTGRVTVPLETATQYFRGIEPYRAKRPGAP